MFISFEHLPFFPKYRDTKSGGVAKDTSLPGAGAFKPSDSNFLFDLSSLRRLPIAPTRITLLSFGRRAEVTLAEEKVEIWRGAGRLGSGPRCKHPNLVASVMLNDAVVFRSGDLDELVRARRVIVAFDAYVSWGTNAKKESSVTKGTPAGHASDGTIIFRGGSRELQLERSVPSVIVLRNEDAFDVRNADVNKNEYERAGESHGGLICAGGSHAELARCRGRSGVSTTASRATDEAYLAIVCSSGRGRGMKAGSFLWTKPPPPTTPLLSYIWASLFDFD